MAAGMRIGWFLAALLVGAVGTPARADALRGGGSAARSDLATWLPTWGNAGLYRNFFSTGAAAREYTPVTAPAAPVAVAPVVVPPVVPAPVVAPPAAPQVFAGPVPAAPAPVAAAAPAADAFINTGVGPYPEAALITSGGAAPWYDSTPITGLFGGPPTAQQQAAFTAAVMQDVRQAFAASGVAVTLTGDPNAHAAHTLSLVSNTVPPLLPTAIGMTDVGANGFSFIDQEAKSAQSVNQLALIAAHNIAHELMLAFGVGENYDTSGNYIDARNASLAMMLDPNARFSPAAAAALNQALAAADGSAGTTAAQVLGAQSVPEPATAALWVAGLLAAAALGFNRTGGSGARRNAPPRRSS